MLNKKAAERTQRLTILGRGGGFEPPTSGYEPDELTRLLHPAMAYLKGQGYILLA